MTLYKGEPEARGQGRKTVANTVPKLCARSCYSPGSGRVGDSAVDEMILSNEGLRLLDHAGDYENR